MTSASDFFNAPSLTRCFAASTSDCTCLLLSTRFFKLDSSASNPSFSFLRASWEALNSLHLASESAFDFSKSTTSLRAAARLSATSCKSPLIASRSFSSSGTRLAYSLICFCSVPVTRSTLFTLFKAASLSSVINRNASASAASFSASALFTASSPTPSAPSLSTDRPLPSSEVTVFNVSSSFSAISRALFASSNASFIASRSSRASSHSFSNARHSSSAHALASLSFFTSRSCSSFDVPTLAEAVAVADSSVARLSADLSAANSSSFR